MKKRYTLLALLMLLSPLQNLIAGEVARAQFTSAIEAREPVDEITVLSNNVNKVYFFSELRNLQGETVTHRWIYAGKLMAEVSFNVGGPRWRVNSSKTLLPSWTGKWSVAVVDGTGAILSEDSFQYIEAVQ
ncbi:MAG TPA: DUF2914 domain-containing protein [Chromatiales bacterium]|nr:DUF2914 domain-containing protein [Chromatiales bacterium]